MKTHYILLATSFTKIQGGQKKPDCFSDLITLWRLVSERRAVCQNFLNFIQKKATKLVFQWVLIFFAKFAQIITTAEIMLYMTGTRGFYSTNTNTKFWHTARLFRTNRHKVIKSENSPVFWPTLYLLTYLYAVVGCDARRVLESQTVREQLIVGVGQRAHRVVVHPDRRVDVAVVAVLIARWRRRLLRLGVVRSPVRRHHV